MNATEKNRSAPGGPGIPARWTSSAKTGVGTALSSTSHVWFTLSHGIFNEIYYPRIDHACVRDMGLIITDEADFFSEEKRGAGNEVEWLIDGVPGFRVVNTCRDGRYRIEKQIVTDPHRDTALQRGRFIAQQGALSDYHLHVLLAPHLGNQGSGHTAWLGELEGTPLLFAQREENALALACSAPWTKRSVGYVGSSDGWQEWMKTHASLKKNGLSPGDLSRISIAVLRAHESKTAPGGLIASLSIPWGFSKGDDDLGGYHLVWSRDMVEAAGGWLAAGAHEEARRVLSYLQATQQPDGHWSQNMWLDGSPCWNGIQMDETALPILLVDLAHREKALAEVDVARFWPMVKKAAGYLARNGPVSPQDRWEEDPGHSPFTVGAEIAALLAAADLADLNREPSIASYLREIADVWHTSIERWMYVSGTDWCRKFNVEGYYVRIAPIETGEGVTRFQNTVHVKNVSAAEDTRLARHLVSPDALALVRFGVRAADDPRIRDTTRVIDALLKVETPSGPTWHRYNDDGYGEHADGAPFDGTGIGRGWPLLTGERAHYELAAGRVQNATQLLVALEQGLYGKVDRIGLSGTNLTFHDPDGKSQAGRSLAVADHKSATSFLIDWFEAQQALASVKAVGHRVVHGMTHSEPEQVTPELMDELRRITPYDPDHLPREIELIETFRQRHPKLPQVACFDTAFHHTMPRVAKLLPIPRRFDAKGVQRYGFHGLSYTYLMEELARLGDPAATTGRVILAHLGNGASLAAVRDGKSIDTSMGFTPTAGLVMSTRAGDLDPGLAPYLARTEQITTGQFYEMVNHESGLLGVSEISSDMRDLLARQAGDVRAAEAVALFCYQAKKWIGSFAAALGGLDTLVFAGGIGENAPLVRARICEGLSFLGIELTESRNAEPAGVISTDASRVAVRVIRTDEELMIARSVSRTLGFGMAGERTKKGKR